MRLEAQTSCHCTMVYMFHKIHCSTNHTFEAVFPRVHGPARLIHLGVLFHFRYLIVPRCQTVQLGRLFVPACMELWNSLDGTCLANEGVDGF